MEKWISNFQEFQRLVDVEIAPREELIDCWNAMQGQEIRDWKLNYMAGLLTLAKLSKGITV